MSGNENDASDLVLILPHAVVFFIGLPFMIRLIADLVTERGVGLPRGGAWPNVSWAAALGGYQFVIVCIAVHLAAILAACPAATWALDARGIKPEEPSGAAILTIVIAVHWLVVCGLLIWYVRRRGGSARALGLTGQDWARQALRGLRTFLAAMPVVTFLVIILFFTYVSIFRKPPDEHPVLEALQQVREPWTEAVLLAASVLVLPFFEELFWRGIVQTSLLRCGSPSLAIIFSAVLFAASHQWSGGAWTTMPALAALGLALGYVFYRTGSLAAPVALHAAFNLYNVTLQMGGPTLKEWLGM